MRGVDLRITPGEPVRVAAGSTLADGIAVRKAGGFTLPMVREYVDQVVTVEEGDIAADYLEELLDIFDLDGDIDIDVRTLRVDRLIFEPAVAGERQEARLNGKIAIADRRAQVTADAGSAKDGAKVAYTFNQGLLDYDFFAIAKGAPNKDLAMKFLAEISKPEYQAIYSSKIAYGPTNTKAVQKVDPKSATNLPTWPANLRSALALDVNFWVENGEELEERFNAWAAR